MRWWDLRWLNNPEAWQVIRERAAKNLYNECRREAIRQLGYNADPETHDLLLDQLERNPNDQDLVLESARRSFGEGSIKPDVAYLKGRSSDDIFYCDMDRQSVERICQSGEIADVLRALGNCSQLVYQDLNRYLLTLSPLPIEASLASLSDTNPRIVQAAAHIVGKSGDKKHAKAIQQALSVWPDRFSKKHDELQQLCLPPDNKYVALSDLLKKLIWAAGRVGGSEKELIRIAAERQHEPGWEAIRQTALKALQDEKLAAATNKELENLSADFDGHVRELAAQMILQGKRKVSPELVDNILADRISTRHFIKNVKQTGTSRNAIQQAAASPHYQAACAASTCRRSRCQGVVRGCIG